MHIFVAELPTSRIRGRQRSLFHNLRDDRLVEVRVLAEVQGLRMVNPAQSALDRNIWDSNAVSRAPGGRGFAR